VGYRVNHGKSSLAYLPDHEPALGRSGLMPDLRWLSGSDLALNADLLLHDAQYTAEEYADRIGWGHTSLPDAMRFAHLTRVKHLLLTHHDPTRTDAAIDLMLAKLQEAESSYAFTYEMAWEGLKVQL
jgi:ribonuclease BN (tRNA processing enzyme)